MKRVVLLLAVAALSAFAYSRADVLCDVERKTGLSYDRAVRREVQFMTGSELNRATRSFDYTSFRVHALLWFSEREVAILEHQGIAVGIRMTGDFEISDLDRLFRVFAADFKQVNGSAATEYRINCKSFGRWIDPRVR